MKPTAIQNGKTYEIAFGKNTTKVKVTGFDPKNGSWICRTESGKFIPIKDHKRFLKEIQIKEPVNKINQKNHTNQINQKIPKPKGVVTRDEEDAINGSPETIPVVTTGKPEKPVTPDEAKRLLAVAREANIRAGIAKRAFEYGFCSFETVEAAEKESLAARMDVRFAGITERKGGHSIGAMSGLDAAYKVLQEESRPMRAKEITQLAQQRGYCELKGLTPDATIAAAMETEMKRKGDAARFAKVGKGLFIAR
jgi:hypothetical protein